MPTVTNIKSQHASFKFSFFAKFFQQWFPLYQEYVCYRINQFCSNGWSSYPTPALYEYGFYPKYFRYVKKRNGNLSTCTDYKMGSLFIKYFKNGWKVEEYVKRIFIDFL